MGIPKDEKPFSNVFNNEDNSWDIGLIYGGGIGLLFEKSKLFVDARIRASMNDFRRTTYGDDRPEFGVLLKNKGWSLSIGYSIPF